VREFQSAPTVQARPTPHRENRKPLPYQRRGILSLPPIILQSAEVRLSKSESISITYENRTKSAKCGGLETNGARERISGPDGLNAVRRFPREARGYWRFQRDKSLRRKLVAKGLAERKGFELPVCFRLTSGNPVSSHHVLNFGI
jgi:hypothetical protein